MAFTGLVLSMSSAIGTDIINVNYIEITNAKKIGYIFATRRFKNSTLINYVNPVSRLHTDG